MTCYNPRSLAFGWGAPRSNRTQSFYPILRPFIPFLLVGWLEKNPNIPQMVVENRDLSHVRSPKESPEQQKLSFNAPEFLGYI